MSYFINPVNVRRPFLASLNAVPVCKRRVADTDWFPAVDVSDQGGEYLFEFDLPGMKPEEIQMSVDGDALQLNGVRTTRRHGGQSLRVERPDGTFVRRLVLPPESRRNAVQVTLQDGVLQVHVPKQAPENKSEKPLIVHSEEPEHEPTPA